MRRPTRQTPGPTLAASERRAGAATCLADHDQHGRHGEVNLSIFQTAVVFLDAVHANRDGGDPLRLCSATAGVRYVFCCDFSLCNVLVLLEFTPRLSLGKLQGVRRMHGRKWGQTEQGCISYVPSSSIDTVLYTDLSNPTEYGFCSVRWNVL
jgi:hypothetical protein